MRTQPIRVGDKFNDGAGHVWEVIECYPGGKIDLIDRARTYFSMRYHWEVRDWTRLT